MLGVRIPLACYCYDTSNYHQWLQNTKNATASISKNVFLIDI